MQYYFAYGSNLHPCRLTERIATAQLLGTACLEGHVLRYNKLGRDGSGKCNIEVSGEAQVFGAVYRFARSNRALLDRHESGYVVRQVKVSLTTGWLSCYTYTADRNHRNHNLRPFHWYKELVIAGARFLQLPLAYQQQIAACQSDPDPHPQRDRDHRVLLARMKNWRPPAGSGESGFV